MRTRSWSLSVATRAELDLLKEHARKFAKEARVLLNKTVCNGADVGSVVSWDPDLEQDIVNVGTKLDGLIASPVPAVASTGRSRHVGSRRSSGATWMIARRFLMVLSSYFAAILPHRAGRRGLCHYDYERTKEGYPAAHLQIKGDCAALGALPGRRKATELGKLHFPVGGRRYRPTLEDMVEFVDLGTLHQGAGRSPESHRQASQGLP